MPVHDGVWLLDQIHERWPNMIVIVESGALEMVYQALGRAVSRLQLDSI